MNELYYCRLEPGNRSQSHYVDEKFPTKSFFCVPVFLNPTISYFLSFEKRTKSQVRSSTKSQCNIARICKKRGKKKYSVLPSFCIPPFHQISDACFPVGTVFVLLQNKKVISAFSFKGEMVF